MLSQVFLKASLDASRSMGDNVGNINSKVINDIVNSYSHNYKSPEDVLKNHDVKTRDFTNHDIYMKMETDKLIKILKACKITWDSKVKPLAQDLLNKVTIRIEQLPPTENIQSIQLHDICTDAIFAEKINPDRYNPTFLEEPLLNLSFSLPEKNLDEISKMLVESKAANPQAIIDYLAELPQKLIVDVYNEVFVNRNNNNFLPINFRVTGHEYLTSIKYGDCNLDKLYLTIMIASYLLEHTDDGVQVTLTKYEKYLNNLINATCTQAGEWTRAIQKAILVKTVVTRSYMKDNILQINLITNVLKDVSDDEIMEKIIAICHLRPESVISMERLSDPAELEKINNYIHASNYRKHQLMYENTQRAIDEVLARDGDSINVPYTPDIATEIGTYEELYEKVLSWIAISRWEGTYINRLIQIYIRLASHNDKENLYLINGLAMARLAAYIVTH